MKFAIMGMEPRGEWKRLDDAEQNQRVRQHQRILDELAMARLGSGPPGLIFASFGLSEEHEVLTIRCERGGHASIDGPYPETKEVIGGFDIIEFASRREAIDWTVAAERHASHVSEVRQIGELWWVSGSVDRERLMRCERWPESSQRRPPNGAAMELFMLTSIEDHRAAQHLAAGERMRFPAEYQRVGAEYVRQRSMVDHDPGMWVGARFAAAADAATIRASGSRRVACDGPSTGTNEAIGAFNVIACSSRDEAAAWARKLACRDGDVIEIRPVRGSWWIYHE